MQLDNILKDPIKRIIAAFLDCLIDPTCIDNYDGGEPWGELDILRAISMATKLLSPITDALEALAKTIYDWPNKAT